MANTSLTPKGICFEGPVTIFDLVNDIQTKLSGVSFCELALSVRGAKLHFERDSYRPLGLGELSEYNIPSHELCYPSEGLPKRLEHFLNKIRVAFGLPFQQIVLFVCFGHLYVRKELSPNSPTN